MQNRTIRLILYTLFVFHRYIYIADTGNDRVVRWTTNYAAGGVCIVGCTGTSGVAANQLNSPRDLKFDASGNLYVTDQGNNRIQKFMMVTTNCPAGMIKYFFLIFKLYSHLIDIFYTRI